MARILRPALAFALLALATTATAADKVLKDNWAAIYFGGAKVGHLHQRMLERTTDVGPTYVTQSSDSVSLQLGFAAVQLSSIEEVVEREDGSPISFSRAVDQGGATMLTRGKMKDGKLVITTGRGAHAQTTVVDVPDALCPYTFDRTTIAKGFEPGTKYSLRMFLAAEPATGLTADVTVGPKEAVEMFDVHKWLHRVEVTIRELPGARTVMWLDNEGETWLTIQSLGGLQFEMRKVSKEQALSTKNTAAEIMTGLGIVPDGNIRDPRGRPSLTLLVKPKPGAPARRALPQDAFQTVEKQEDGLLVTVRRAQADPKKSYRLPYKGEEWQGLLKPTAWLETGDPIIIRMSKKAVGGETDALKVARRIEAYARRVITTKKLGMGFATALETAKQKAGDCTEHATLAAALARAAGLPSRVVIGMAYAQLMPGLGEQRFLFHMWTEVWVGEWLPIDPAMGAHDATHIALARSDLDAPGVMLQLSAPVLSFMGSTEIEVVE